MTTLYTTKKTCSVCNIVSDQTGISSTNEFGSPDLDTRPPEMKRSTINHWVERCPHCGYCNSTVENTEEGLEDIIYSSEYRSLLENKNYSELTRSFLCQSYIYEYLGKLSASIWSYIHAAWACDDDKNKKGAQKCRIKAFELIQKLWDQDKTLMEEKGGDYLLAADLLRRTEDYEKANKMILGGFDVEAEGIIEELLNAQKKLVDSNIDLCYTMEDALKLVEKH